jgi:hypothetical protein
MFPSNVRLSKADQTAPKSDFRYAADSGHRLPASACTECARSGHGGPTKRFQLKPLNVGARQGGIASLGGKDADHVDFRRHFAVRVFPHVHHHRGDRRTHPADPKERERALLAPFNVLFSCHRR